MLVDDPLLVRLLLLLLRLGFESVGGIFVHLQDLLGDHVGVGSGVAVIEIIMLPLQAVEGVVTI